MPGKAKGAAKKGIEKQKEQKALSEIKALRQVVQRTDFDKLGLGEGNDFNNNLKIVWQNILRKAVNLPIKTNLKNIS